MEAPENLAAEHRRFLAECDAQESRIEGERLTLQFGVRSDRRLDCGKQPITESPLFGGPAQKELF